MTTSIMNSDIQSSFSSFICEANSAGSKFEKKVTKAVNKWLKENSLDKKFKASRF